MIAALFVETDGVYFQRADVDPWDKARDARNYPGPHAVVAHPPCQLWGPFAAVNYKRWGGEHNRPGNDGNCFSSAYMAVLQFGGVLEHPAHSQAWEKYHLKTPIQSGWQEAGQNEWVCEIWQSAYGHKAQKRTWLFYKGHDPASLRWDRPEGTHTIGNPDKRKYPNCKPSLSGKAASATPHEFAEELINLAKNAL